MASAKRGVRGTLREAVDDSDDEDDDVRTLTKGAGLFFSSIEYDMPAAVYNKQEQMRCKRYQSDAGSERLSYEQSVSLARIEYSVSFFELKTLRRIRTLLMDETSYRRGRKKNGR